MLEIEVGCTFEEDEELAASRSGRTTQEATSQDRHWQRIAQLAMQGAQLDADGGALISQTSKVHDAAQQQEVLRAARQLTQARLACQQGLHAQILGCEPSAAPQRTAQRACTLQANIAPPAIGVLPAVGHAQDPSLAVQQTGVHFVPEGGPIDGLTPRPCACGVTPLHA